MTSSSRTRARLRRRDPGPPPVFLFIYEWWRDGSVEQLYLALTLGIEVEEPEDEVIGSLILCRSLSTLFHKYGDVFRADSWGREKVLLCRGERPCPDGALS